MRVRISHSRKDEPQEDNYKIRGIKTNRLNCVSIETCSSMATKKGESWQRTQISYKKLKKKNAVTQKGKRSSKRARPPFKKVNRGQKGLTQFVIKKGKEGRQESLSAFAHVSIDAHSKKSLLHLSTKKHTWIRVNERAEPAYPLLNRPTIAKGRTDQ